VAPGSLPPLLNLAPGQATPLPAPHRHRSLRPHRCLPQRRPRSLWPHSPGRPLPPEEAALPATKPADAPGLASPTVFASENAAFVDQMVELINAARRQESLEPLSPAASLMEAVQRQARAMAESGRLSHTAPDGSTFVGRVQAAGYSGWTALGEVVAGGPASPEAVVEGWLASPEHRARLLDPAYREMGAGYYYLSDTIYGHWWVVDLAAR